MPTPPPEIHPEALEEAAAALEWYSERSPSAAPKYFAAIDHAVDMVAEAPERWPRHVAGTRRYIMLTFPYFIVYTASEAGVRIYAIAHSSRKPGYWKDRLSWSGAGG